LPATLKQGKVVGSIGKKVVSPAQEQFFPPWCLILYARRATQKSNRAYSKKATYQIA
jgi:hypothetical protein